MKATGDVLIPLSSLMSFNRNNLKIQKKNIFSVKIEKGQGVPLVFLFFSIFDHFFLNLIFKLTMEIHRGILKKRIKTPSVA